MNPLAFYYTPDEEHPYVFRESIRRDPDTNEIIRDYLRVDKNKRYMHMYADEMYVPDDQMISGEYYLEMEVNYYLHHPYGTHDNTITNHMFKTLILHFKIPEYLRNNRGGIKKGYFDHQNVFLGDHKTGFVGNIKNYCINYLIDWSKWDDTNKLRDIYRVKQIRLFQKE